MAEIEAQTLGAYLADAIPGFFGVPDLVRIAGGQSNPTYFVTTPSHRLVLRTQPSGDLLPSAHAIDREYRVLSALAATPVAVPATLLYCNDRTIIGTPFYIMQRLEGRVFHECTLPGVTMQDRAAMYVNMATTLAALHNVRPEAVGLDDFGRQEGYFARQIRRWSQQWQAARTREDVHIERLMRWLPAHVPEDDLVSIVHGDYRIGNLMFDGTSVAGVLDWELSTLGHPLADLAHCCMAWDSAPDEYGGLAGLDLPGTGIPDRAAFEAAYYAGANHGARLTPFHRALAMFRWSVIFEGIAARAKSGNAAAENAESTGRLSAVFAKRAVQYLD